MTPEPLIAIRLRQLLWGIALLATLFTPLELIFSKHYQEPSMLIPFAMVGLALVGLLAVWRWPSRQILWLFQGVMGLLFVVSALGVWFHLQGNLEVVREVTPNLAGWPMLWKVLSGAAPALAPGLLAFVGMLGLAFTFQHPAWGHSTTTVRN